MEDISKQLKEKLLNMMKWFHGFCVENNLTYYALGGTMLGAARHNGFIPWDDDIDVGMPRSDYEKMCIIFNNNPSDVYVLETPKLNDEGYCYPISKLYDTTTTLTEKKRKLVKRGVFIDIFPLDGIGNTEEEARERYKCVEKKYNLLLSKVCGIRKGRELYKNIAAFSLGICPFINVKKLILNLDNLCSKYDYDSHEWIGNLLGAWRFKEIMPKHILGSPTLYQFEDMEIYGAENYDAYLTYLYGDWRKLPPIEKRVTHHDFIFCDLNRSYLVKK